MSEVVGGAGGGVAECMDEYEFMCAYAFCARRSDRDSPEVRQGAAAGIFSDGDGH